MGNSVVMQEASSQRKAKTHGRKQNVCILSRMNNQCSKKRKEKKRDDDEE